MLIWYFFFNRELSLSAGFHNWGPVVALDRYKSVVFKNYFFSGGCNEGSILCSGIPKTEELDGGERQ